MTRELPAGPYLVLGCARAGFSAARALRERCPDAQISVWDAHGGPANRRRAERLEQLGVEVRFGPWRPGLLAARHPAAVIKSPGLPADAAPVRQARAHRLPVFDELELGRRLTDRRLVAVTGTDGKSTVSALIAAALGGDGPVPVAGNTEFGPPLSGIAAAGGTVVVEASSYQLEFTGGPLSELAVLTNLTVDHLHRHGTMAVYGAVKRRLFVNGTTVVPQAVINVDGDFGAGLAGELRAAGAAVATFGAGPGAAYRVLDARWDAVAGQVRLATPIGELRLQTRLPGRHNAENVAAALAACDLLALPRERTIAVLESMPGVPGRWERIDRGQPYEVVVDFAHTLAGIRQALVTARHVTEARGGRVHLVLGAAGNNNDSKRPPLMAILGELADRVILTEGNGRGESLDAVVADLMTGWPARRPVPPLVPDRRLAIRRALSEAGTGDLVMIIGRGVMPRLLSHSSGDGRRFDDREVAGQELARLDGDAARSEAVFEHEAIATGPQIVLDLIEDLEAEVAVQPADDVMVGAGGGPNALSAPGAQPGQHLLGQGPGQPVPAMLSVHPEGQHPPGHAARGQAAEEVTAGDPAVLGE
jgi:UDP-N-acetylmuramyl tripeptide synthase